jgi:hypothetical protein
VIWLRDAIEIKASPEQVFEWLAHFQKNYLAWHPDHVACRYLKGTSLEVGSIIYTEEYLHGQLHKLKFQVTQVIPDSRVNYKVTFGLGGAFIVEPHEDYVRFIAEIYMGSRLPLLGWCIDLILQTLLVRQIEALKQHMAEEGESLKRLLERTV